MAYTVDIQPLARECLIDLRADSSAQVVLSDALGVTLPGSRAVAAAADIRVLPQAPGHWLLRAPLPDEDRWMTALSAAIAGQFAAVTLVSDAYAGFRVSGRDVLDVLKQGIAIDLHPDVFGTDQATRCAFAKISAIVERLAGNRGYDILVESAFAKYAHTWLKVAGGDQTA